MADYDVIRDAIISLLNGDGDNLYTGDVAQYKPIGPSPPSTEADAVYAFLNYLAKGITDGFSYFTDAFEAYWTGPLDGAGSQTVTSTEAALQFNNVRFEDRSFDFNGGDAVEIQDTGTYCIDFGAAFQGGSSKREVVMRLYQNGNPVGGTTTIAAWDGASLGASSSTHTIINANQGDILQIGAQLVAGSGPVNVISDTAIFVILRIRNRN